MMISNDETQLVLIDYQEKLLSTLAESAIVFANAIRLANAAKILRIPIFGTEHYPANLGLTLPVLKNCYQKTLIKMQFSAVAEGLTEWLRPEVTKAPAGNARSLPKHLQKNHSPEQERSSVVIAGCETHISLLQTALDLLEDDFSVWVVTDACSSRTERNRDAAFDRLAGAGVELVTTEMVIYEWLRTSEHPAFDAVMGKIN